MFVLELLAVIFGTGITSSFLPQIATRLAGFVRRFRSQDAGFNKRLVDLERALLIIQSHVDDAETKPSLSSFYQLAIKEFKDVLFDTEDFLDGILLDFGKLTSEGRTMELISLKPKLLNEIIRLAEKVTELTHKMERCIVSEASHQPTSLQTVPHQISGSFTDNCAIERADDLQKIINLVCNQNRPGVSVVPIVGMVGIGKTTLAQQVFNDQRVVDHFGGESNRRWWVSVRLDDDVLQITNSICDTSNLNLFQPPAEENADIIIHKLSTLDYLQKKIKQIVETNERFLLVLDGLWDINVINWETLKVPFESVAPGSMILVTTRSHIVSSLVSTDSYYCLSVLSDRNCWDIIKRSLRNIPNGDAEFENNGLEIAKKCNGLPLVAKVIGSLLRLKSEHMPLNDALKSEIWNLAEDRNQIYPVLKFGYDHLPPHLKRCFGYSSLLPHSRPFRRDDLIKMWEAEGLIRARGARKVEEIGRDYFDDLCSRSFFRVQPNDGGEYAMNGFIHDLARLVSTNECFAYEASNKSQVLPLSTNVRRWSWVCDDNFESDMLEDIPNKNKWRTFMLFSNITHRLLGTALTNLFGNLLCLRVLNLSGSGISELSENIGIMELLRHLNVSNTLIRKLPDSIERLFGLEILNVKNCPNLIAFPARFYKLSNLRCIDCDDRAELSKCVELGKLTRLESLPEFMVETTPGRRIDELKDMNNLRGSICIKQLENVGQSTEAEVANLHQKKHLDDLKLQWKPRRTIAADRQILEALEPHHMLKSLQVQGYCGVRFPVWMSDSRFQKLVKMNIKNCKHCNLLPSLGSLPMLKDLVIEEMESLEFVDDSFNGSARFPSLEKLKFEKMLELLRWEGIRAGDMPLLKELTIETCPKFVGLPSLCFLTSLEKLEIRDCETLQSFPAGGLPRSLENLFIFESDLLEQTVIGQHWDVVKGIRNIWADFGAIQVDHQRVP